MHSRRLACCCVIQCSLYRQKLVPLDQSATAQSTLLMWTWLFIVPDFYHFLPLFLMVIIDYWRHIRVLQWHFLKFTKYFCSINVPYHALLLRYFPSDFRTGALFAACVSVMCVSAKFRSIERQIYFTSGDVCFLPSRLRENVYFLCITWVRDVIAFPHLKFKGSSLSS